MNILFYPEPRKSKEAETYPDVYQNDRDDIQSSFKLMQVSDWTFLSSKVDQKAHVNV